MSFMLLHVISQAGKLPHYAGWEIFLHRDEESSFKSLIKICMKLVTKTK